MSVYDAIAPSFDRQRVLPDGIPETIRDAILRARLPPSPRILDLGAGSGRFGRSFVVAGDDYTGVDLSFGMLRAFASRVPAARLAQADGARLPFEDSTFDAVLLIQVLSGATGWRHLLGDAMRVLRPAGTLIVGRVVAPDDGIDTQMKFRLANILDGMGIRHYREKPRDDALSWLARQMPNPTILTAAAWIAERSPDAFLARHAGGARFSVLDDAVRQEALRQLADWASEQFGSLDAVAVEHYRFELIIHSLQGTPT